MHDSDFPSLDGRHPSWSLLPRSYTVAATGDGTFDSADLVLAFQANAYEKSVDATWLTGDWNGDGRFTTADLVAAYQNA